MSLINDALKRANQARQQNPFSAGPVAPLQPVDDAAGPKWFFRAVIGLLLLMSLGLSGWFFWQGSRADGRSQRVTPVSDSSTATPSTSPSTAESLAQHQPIKVSTNIIVRTNTVAPAQSVETNSSAPLEVTQGAAPTNIALPAVPPSPFADLKLQSIIFREDKPAALINGELLVAGEKVRGARILKIERESVTVERGGETNELWLRRL